MHIDEFRRLKQQGYNKIPLIKEILSDLDTPLSTYLKLADQPYTYLFESVTGGEKKGRYSIIGLSCTTRISVKGEEVSLLVGEQILESVKVDDPFAYIDGYLAKQRVPAIKELPQFSGGLVGYFSYDSVRYVEKSLKEVAKEDPINVPDILLLVSDELIVFDNLKGSLYVVVHVDANLKNTFQQGQKRLLEIENKLHQELKRKETAVPPLKEKKQSDVQYGFKERDHAKAVEQVKEYIVAGDVMQVVLSQRMEASYEGEPLDLYRALRYLNPSPYMFYLNLGDHHVVGSSPEILARLEGETITLRPIAGTRRRGRDEKEDLALEKELMSDPKELAEHLMLIDLGRNDVGRVAKTGSVELTEQMVVERYSHVMHITSNVVGKLKNGLTACDVLKASLPAGTLSGAPKVRAMEIIDELEPVKRGIYGGAVGYLSWVGNMDTAIAIRTAVIKNKRIYIQAGGGLVADSIPRLEWKETMNKSRAIFQAMSLADVALQPHNLRELEEKQKLKGAE